MKFLRILALLLIANIATADARVLRGSAPVIGPNAALSGIVGFDSLMFPFVNRVKMASAFQTQSGSGPWGAVPNYPNFIQAGTNLPTGTLTGRLGYSVGLDTNYFGKWVLVVNGTVSGANGITLGFNVNNLGTVYSTTGSPTLGNCTNGNVPPCSFGASSTLKTQGTNYTIKFDNSALVTGAANNGSGLVRLTVPTTNGITTSSSVTVSGVVGSNGNGCGANGSFAVTAVTSTTIDLTGSTFPGGCTYTSGGQLFPYQATTSYSLSFNFDTGTYSNFSSFLLCKEADYNADNTCNTTAGATAWPGGFDDYFVGKVAALHPAHIRYLDVNRTINSSVPGDWASFPSSSAWNYNLQHDWWVISNWFGSNSGTDTYSIACSNGTACTYLLTGGAPKDGDYIQFLNVNANLTANPTVTITDANSVTSSAIPIFSIFGSEIIAGISGTAGSSGTISLTFNTTPLGAYTCLAGGTHTTSNVTINNGDSSSTIKTNLFNVLQADTTLTAQPTAVSSRNSGGTLSIYFASRACTTTVTANLTGATGVTTAIGTTSVGTLAANTLYSMTYSSLLGGFVQGIAGGMESTWPYLTQMQLANAVSTKSGVQVGCWLQSPLLWSAASFTSLASLANSNQCLGGTKFELNNEVWNTGTFASASLAIGLGASVGFTGTGGGDGYAYYELRQRQLWAIAKSTFGGSLSGNLHTISAWQLGGSVLNELNGTTLCGTSCSNQAYQNAIGVDYTVASGNGTPGSYTRHLSQAPYYHGTILSGSYGSSYATWSATSSSVVSNVLTVAGTVTGTIWWNQGVASCDGAYIAAPTASNPVSAQLTGTVTATLNGTLASDNTHTWVLTSTAGLSAGMYVYNQTTGLINGTISSVDSGTQITQTGKAYASAGAHDTIVFGGKAGTYQLNATSCSIASGTITGGDILGVQYAADNYCTASGACSTGNVGLGSVLDAYNWLYQDLITASRNNNMDNGSQGQPSTSSQISYFKQIASVANSLGIDVEDYEGGYDGFPPTTSNATTMGLASGYGMSGNPTTPKWDGYIGLMMLAWKQNASFKTGVTYQINQQLSFEPAGSLGQWYVFSGNARWTLFAPPSQIYATPYQSYNAICAYNGC